MRDEVEEENKTKSNRKSVGELSLDLSKKDTATHSVIDQMREQLNDYDRNVNECVQSNLNTFHGDFYVVVITKKERLMQNVLRGYFFARQSCPTPDYDQVVYRYIKEDARLKFLWVVPDVHAVNYMVNNPASVGTDRYALLNFVLKFSDGSLLRLSKELNCEKKDSNIIEK